MSPITWSRSLLASGSRTLAAPSGPAQETEAEALRAQPGSTRPGSAASGGGVRVRLRFTKRGKVRFISHRDVARAFERAFRVLALPLAFTQGFAPRPKVAFGLALSVGHESEAEYLDFELAEPVDLARLAASLTEALPDGIDVTGVVVLPPRSPSLQESVSVVAYRVEVPAPASQVRAAVASALSAPTLDARRRRKGGETVEDVRPAIVALDVCDAPAVPVNGAARREDPVEVEMELRTRPVNVRPGELLDALGLPTGRVLRMTQWIEDGGARFEPLGVADARELLVEARA